MNGNQTKLNSKSSFVVGIVAGVAVVAVVALIFVLFLMTGTGDKAKVADGDISATANAGDTAGNTTGNTAQPTDQPANADNNANVVVTDQVSGIKTFELKSGATICKEGGKPVVYLFSTTGCPHCRWIKDTFDSWAKKNADKIVAYHWEVDTGDNTLTSAVEKQVPAAQEAVYTQFNPEGYVPTFVFGCKYSRVGNGYERQGDLTAEVAEYNAVMADLLK